MARKQNVPKIAFSFSFKHRLAGVFSARIHENVKHYGTHETADNRNRAAVSIMRRY